VNPDSHSLTVSNSRVHDSDPDSDSREILRSAPESGSSGSGINLNDILFILFRHKWKIIASAMAGILASAAFYFLAPAQYESQAKLFVRYVVDRSAVDGLDSQTKTLDSPSDGAISSEAEILTSTDVAMQVAAAVGADRLVPELGAQATNAKAALAILKDLEVTVVKGSGIITVSYRNKDPKLAIQVLQELVKRYFDKHLEVHRSLGAFDYVTREADQLKAQLNQTEEELKELKTKAGITSLTEDTTALATELTKVQSDLDAAEGELAAQKARVGEIEKLVAGADAQQSGNTALQPSSDIVREYQTLGARVARLREGETELLAKYTQQNRIVKVKQGQIDEQEKQMRSMEKKYPGLVGTVSTVGSSQNSGSDIVTERARLTELETRVETLRTRFKTLQARAALLSEMGPKISQLERKKEVEETNYKYYGASLEKARIDETLDPSRMPNISVVQAPSPPDRAKRDLKKLLIGLAAGGLAIGLALALLIELVLDRTIKRPLELETRLRIPLLLSIPNISLVGDRLRLHGAGDDSELAMAHDGGSGAETGEMLRPFCEAIRDRLGLYFEMNQMTHKPKLVAVTGLSKNAGASTLAAGLAVALSDSGDGRVLLVDKPLAPKRFYDMLSEFKAGNLDYVVFDMPSLGDTSSTLPLAGYMDKVLLVVEAEKSNRESIKRAYSQLAAKVDVSVIFNKSRSYGPKWLEGEI
jgi:succinoglycan biosynthesis transport protein ExoP